MNLKSMTRDELLREAINMILSLTDEQAEQLLSEFRKEYPDEGEVSA